jgi:hypothetical protein
MDTLRRCIIQLEGVQREVGAAITIKKAFFVTPRENILGSWTGKGHQIPTAFSPNRNLLQGRMRQLDFR